MPDPQEDPRITDLARYRRARERARKEAARQKPSPPPAGFLGNRPRAGLILVIVIALLALLYVAPRFMR